ncbi:MAG TPA: S1 RNA-binding domain-containing protein [Polyangiaceae bacterium]|jgi:small subunit ribosomal protein S1|nr:S1 RNA-binding domain-containing protein [Polyangiaceae bacterium]
MKTGDDPNSFAALFEASPKKGAPRKWRLGDVLDLEVVRVGKSEVFLALDGKQEGYIEAGELTDRDGKPQVFVGSRIAARIVQVDRNTGAIRLSPVSTEPLLPAVADAAGSATAAPQAAVVPGMKVKGKVVNVERYGVFVEFSILGAPKPARGLVPVSELGAPRGADLRKMFPLGSELSATVLSVDERGRNRLSVTALAAAEERRAFESFVAGPEETQGKGAPKPGFGTFADLMKKRSS